MSAVDIFKQAKLAPRHLHRLLGVSRVTVSLWLNGHGSPHRLLEHRVDDLAKRVKQALDEGKLPIPKDVDMSDEVRYVQTVLSST